MSCCAATRPAHGGAADGGEARPALAWWRLVCGAALAGNMMTLSLAINLAEASAGERYLLHLVLLAATSVVTLLLGGPLLRNLAAMWSSRRPDVEALFVVAMAGALLFSVYSTFVSGGPVYYEVVALLLAIYGLGQRLKLVGQRRIEAQLLHALLAGARAHVVDDDGRIRPLDAARVEAGMLLRVHPGEPIVADGTIVQGEASVQTVTTTGEPFGRVLGVGDNVLATWTALDATLLVRAACRGDARRVDRIAALVRSGAAAKVASDGRPTPQTQLLVERLVRWFAPTVLAVSLATFVFWARVDGLEQAWLCALSVLLVACPCALGFAVPLGLRLGAMRLGQLGVEVHAMSAIERMARADRIYFDKTGTLTRVAVRVEDVVLLEGRSAPKGQLPGHAGASGVLDSPAALFALVQSVQRLVAHPIAAAFTASAQALPSPWRVLHARAVASRGVEADCTDERGRPHLLQLGGPEAWVDADAAPAVARTVATLPPQTKPLVLCIDGAAIAVVGLRERPFTAVAPLFAALAAQGVAAEVLSGDSPERVAELLVSRAQASVTAEQKGARVAEHQAAGGFACFVGDGFNDAAAMAGATTAVALSDSSALARSLADFVLPAGEPERILQLLRVCRTTYRSTRINVAITVAYNACGMALAATGWLNPVVAALLMLASSLTVSGRTLYSARAAPER